MTDLDTPGHIVASIFGYISFAVVTVFILVAAMLMAAFTLRKKILGEDDRERDSEGR